MVSASREICGPEEPGDHGSGPDPKRPDTLIHSQETSMHPARVVRRAPRAYR